MKINIVAKFHEEKLIFDKIRAHLLILQGSDQSF